MDVNWSDSPMKGIIGSQQVMTFQEYNQIMLKTMFGKSQTGNDVIKPSTNDYPSLLKQSGYEIDNITLSTRSTMDTDTFKNNANA